MKYLSAFLNSDEISPSPQGKEPIKPIQPVKSVLSVGSPRNTEKLQPAQTPSPIQSSKSSRGVAASTPYRHAVEALPGDCWAIDPLWLCDKHYPLWMEMKNLDDVLGRLEKEGMVEECQLALARLVSVVKKALALYESEQKQTGEVRQ
jgi:hypothetical protein